jgi:hypothetical protein
VRAQDFKNFEEDRKNFSEFCREDMAKCELKVKQAEMSVKDHLQCILGAENDLGRVKAEAKARIETLESYLELERQASTRLRYELAMSVCGVKVLKTTALEREAAALGPLCAAADEIIRLREESKAHAVVVQEIEKLTTLLKARDDHSEYLKEQLAEAESKIKQLFENESQYNPRLQKQAAVIEILRKRIIAAGHGTLWDQVASTIDFMSAPVNVVYRASDGIMQRGSAARYATPFDK